MQTHLFSIKILWASAEQSVQSVSEIQVIQGSVQSTQIWGVLTVFMYYWTPHPHSSAFNCRVSIHEVQVVFVRQVGQYSWQSKHLY